MGNAQIVEDPAANAPEVPKASPHVGVLRVRPPFFIVGAQRSGTTMLRLMINSHPDILVPFESGFITTFYERLAQYGDLKQKLNLARLLEDIAKHPLVVKGKLVENADAILSNPISSYADLIYAILEAQVRKHSKKYWGDKTPSYVTEIDILRKVFPACKVIHLIRDGRDVALSNRSVGWGIHNLPRAARDWHWKVTLGRKMGNMMGDAYLEVRYEDLVTHPEQTLVRVCEFLTMPYDKQMLAYHSRATEMMPGESLQWHQNSVQAPNAELAGAWKSRMSRADRILFEEVAGSGLAEFGYPTEKLSATLGSRVRSLYYATLQRW